MGCAQRHPSLRERRYLAHRGLAIGWLAGRDGIAPLDRGFFDLFKGLLAFFLLEMGLVAASRYGDLCRAGVFQVAFATLMPLAAAGLGLITGLLLGCPSAASRCWPRCTRAKTADRFESSRSTGPPHARSRCGSLRDQAVSPCRTR